MGFRKQEARLLPARRAAGRRCARGLRHAQTRGPRDQGQDGDGRGDLPRRLGARGRDGGDRPARKEHPRDRRGGQRIQLVVQRSGADRGGAEKHGSRRRRRAVVGHAAPQGRRHADATAAGRFGAGAGRLRTGLRHALRPDGRRTDRTPALGLRRTHPPRDRRSGGRGPRHGLRRTGGVHRHFDAPGEDGHARRLAGRGAGDAQRTERYLLYGLLRQRSRPDPGDRRRQVPDRGADRTHGHPGARRRPTAAGRHRRRGARLCDTRAQRHDLRGTAGVGHRRRGRFGNGYRQGRRRGRGGWPNWKPNGSRPASSATRSSSSPNR